MDWNDELVGEYCDTCGKQGVSRIALGDSNFKVECGAHYTGSMHPEDGYLTFRYARIERDTMQVYNKRHGQTPPDAVYVGRPTKFGNRWSHLKHAPHGTTPVHTRREAVLEYALYVLDSPDRIRSVREELAGKSLECFCAPELCHADVLLIIANAPNRNTAVDRLSLLLDYIIA